MITAHTPQYTADGSIILQAAFPWLDADVPFAASPNDPEAHGRELYQRAIAGEFGPIAEYVAPPPAPAVIPSAVSMRQARLALLEFGILDDVTTAMAAQSQAAQIEWEYATEVRRDSALVSGLAGTLGLDSAQLDALFSMASAK